MALRGGELEMDEKLGAIISSLDTAVGMLIVASVKDQTVRKAMELVTQASFDLGILIDDMSEEQPDQERWENAITHAREMLEIYKNIPAGSFGAMSIASDISRYDRGDRDLSLLGDLEGIK